MNPMSEIVVTYVMNVLWMTGVVAAATFLLSRALRRCPSSYQHALWVAALLLAVLLPFVSLRGSRTNTDPRPESAAAANMVEPAQTGHPEASSWALWRSMGHRGQTVLFAPLFVETVALLYLGFVFYRAVRLYCGWRSLRVMRHGLTERPITPAMRALVERCQSRLGVKPLPILLSLDGRGPATLGFRNPVLVLPEWLLSQASQDEFPSILCHELAHVRRSDFLLTLVYELFLLPISFHPAAVLIKARIDQTRELACDEIAAESMSMPTQYARSLLRVAQSMAANKGTAITGYALGLFDTNTLEDRIMNVLGRAPRICKRRAQASAVAVLGLLLMLCLAVSGFSFQVVQPSNTAADLQPFVGTWHAQFKGRTFLTVNLQKQQGKLTGTLSHADIQVDKDGELTSAEEHEGSDPIAEAKLTSGILHIITKEETSQDTIEFEMKITGTDQAALRVLAPPDVPVPKPWKLERAKGSQ
jgi:beta-lactamase regulating signal transducer with metallopeptidase domain